VQQVIEGKRVPEVGRCLCNAGNGAERGEIKKGEGKEEKADGKRDENSVRRNVAVELNSRHSGLKVFQGRQPTALVVVVVVVVSRAAR